MVSLAAMTKRMTRKKKRKKRRKRKRTTHPTLSQTCARSMRTLTTWVQVAANAMMNAKETESAAQR